MVSELGAKIVISGIVVVVMIVIFFSVSNPRVQEANENVDMASLNLIDECANPALWDSGVESCKDDAIQIQERCKSSPSMKVCSDPRIDLIINNPDDIEGRQAWKNHVNSLTIKLIDICQNDFVSDCYESLDDLKQKCASTVYVPACDDPRIEMMLSGINQSNRDGSNELSQYDDYFPDIPEIDVMLDSTDEYVTNGEHLVQSCITIATEYNEITESNDEEMKSGEYYLQLRDDINTCNKTIGGISVYCMVLGVCEGIQQYKELK